MFTQLLHVERVRQAAHVKHKVGFERQTVFKAEADAMHRNGVVVVLQKQVGNARFHPRRRNVRRIDDVIGDLFDRAQHLALQAHGLLQRALHRFGKRVLAARLLKAVDKHGLGCIHKQNFIRLVLRLQCFERAEKRLKKLAAAGIRDDRHAALNTLGFIAKIVKDRNERRGQIIDTIKADILHGVHGARFARAG